MIIKRHCLSKIRVIYVCVMLFHTCCLTAKNELGRLNQNNDHGLWLDQSVTTKLDPFWSFNFHTIQRWGADYHILYNQQYEGLFFYKITQILPCMPLKRFSLACGYNQTEGFQKNIKGIYHWIDVHKPILEVLIDFNYKKWCLSQRFRWAMHVIDRKKYINHTVYRYRVILYTPWKWTSKCINPFIYNESFFRAYSQSHPSSLVSGWVHNRFRLGVVADLVENQVVATLYWQWRILKQKPKNHPRWNNTYQIGWIMDFFF